MKKMILFVFAALLGISVHAQSVLGKWMTIDDKTGAEKSIVEIYSENGKV